MSNSSVSAGVSSTLSGAAGAGVAATGAPFRHNDTVPDESEAGSIGSLNPILIGASTGTGGPAAKRTPRTRGGIVSVRVRKIAR